MTYTQALSAVKSAMTDTKADIKTAIDAILQVSDGDSHLEDIYMMLNTFNNMVQSAVKYEAAQFPPAELPPAQ